MAATKLTASGTSDGYVALAGDDGSLELWVGPNGAKLKALAIDATGGIALLSGKKISAKNTVKAWANFLHPGGAGALTLQAGDNTATFARTASGTYAVVFTTPMADSFYTVGVQVSQTGVCGVAQGQTTAGFTLFFFNSSAQTAIDPSASQVSGFSVIGN